MLNANKNVILNLKARAVWGQRENNIFHFSYTFFIANKLIINHPIKKIAEESCRYQVIFFFIICNFA